MAGIADIVTGIFKPISDVIDHLTVSGDAKVALQKTVVEGQIAAAQAVTDYEKQLLAAQTSVINAEASQGNWLQRSWRPILMLVFGGLIVARWLGWAAPNLPAAEALELWGIVKIGLGGYVIGRSVEKTAPAVTKAIAAAKG